TRTLREGAALPDVRLPPGAGENPERGGIQRLLRPNGGGQGHRGVQHVRAPPASVLRKVPRRLHPVEARDRTEQDCATGEYVRAAAADSGAADEPDREGHPGEPEPGRRGRGHRGAASLYGDAWRGKAALFRGD